MMEEQKLNPDHPVVRRLLRVVGPLTAGAGLVFIVIGIGSFFSAFASRTLEPPRYFWCVFVGVPLLGVGVALTKYAFLGAIYRYFAGEVAPVGRDTFNYFAEGTQRGVRTTAAALGEGLASGWRGDPSVAVRCHQCDTPNDAGARFCKACGVTVLTSKPCPSCRASNDPDAVFCDQCGMRFTESPTG